MRMRALMPAAAMVVMVATIAAARPFIRVRGHPI
ncbi:hypothetical protein SAMN05428973_101964 [Duganella sp. OV510]|jgi:hypothetical protein|nr:hypothetical protein SAMN05428973_101964 [Duganella sp. OV510]